MSGSRGPRLARWLLTRVLPADVRQEIVEDLDELFHRRLGKGGRLGARVWYWGESLSFSARFAAERLREAYRVSGGGPFALLDVKLALRRLRKQWGLTLVGGLAMATAMTMGGLVFGVLDAARVTSLPLDEGDRVVALQAWDTRLGARRSIPFEDLERWEARLGSVEDVGAFRTVARNMVPEDGLPEPVTVAEMTASGFALARVPPLLGRPLVPGDAAADAPPVVVIGFDVWRARFESDPDVVGRRIRLGGTVHTVVGVMPEGFAFPVSHRWWTPLRLADGGAVPTGDGRGAVFGRLAPGATLEQADAELSTLGVRASDVSGDGPFGDRESRDERPDGDGARIRTGVVPYAFAFTDGAGDPLLAGVFALLAALLLVPPCANLAILIYARTVSRQEEFAARHALGASRSRIVGQLFVETLMLSAVAGAVSLVVVRVVLGELHAFLGRQLPDGVPFWFDVTPSLRTALLVAGLALLAAVLAGLLPALKATGRMMTSSLATLGGRSGPRLGRTWTALVVAQVAFAVAALPLATEMAWGTLRPGVLGPGFPADRFLTAGLAADAESPHEPDSPNQPGVDLIELLRRLEAEPGVAGATLASGYIGGGTWSFLEMEPIDGADPAIVASPLQRRRHQVQVLQVRPGHFEDMAIPLVGGRGFDGGDLVEGASPAVVSESFGRLVLGGRSPIGLRFRYLRRGGGTPAASEPPPWHEIVGVVRDVPAHRAHASAFHPGDPGAIEPATLMVRLEAGAAVPPGRIRAVAAEVDPALRVENLRSLDAVYRQHAWGNNLGAFALAAATLSVLLLSAGGMYALMSFTVNRRRREIGIRAALGAGPGRLLAGVFGRAARQLGLGAALGGLLALALDLYVPDGLLEVAGGWNVPGVLPATAALMLVVGLAAAYGPARRGLDVQPTEAMRDA